MNYGSVAVLDGVSFTVAEGEFFGILGPNGAGKTTLLRMVAGALEPDSGQVRIGATFEPHAGLGLEPEFLAGAPHAPERLVELERLKRPLRGPFFFPLEDRLVPEARQPVPQARDARAPPWSAGCSAGRRPARC